MTQQRTPGAEKVLSIQAARAAAAILVVLYHSSRLTALPNYLGHRAFGGLLEFGHAGVDFFFVLSGFIILFVHRADIGQPARLARYAWRRVVRIYPVYWVITLVLIGLALASPDRALRLEPVHLIASVLLVPHGQDPLLGVAWTLQHEMLFYLVFAVLILSARAGLVAFAAWAVVVVLRQTVAAGDLSGAGFAGGLFEFVGGNYNLQFFLGLGAALLVRRGGLSAPAALTLAVAGAGAFVGAGLAEDAGLFSPSGVSGRIIFGAAAMAAIVGLACAERAGALRVGKVGVFLGAASYSIYLVHTVVISLGIRLLEAAGVTRLLADWLSVVALVVAALLASLLVHVYIELPLLRRLRDAAGRTRTVPFAAAADQTG